MLDYVRSTFSYLTKLLLAGKPQMARQQLDSQELDEVLSRYTSELPNPLQGVTFMVCNAHGRPSRINRAAL